MIKMSRIFFAIILFAAVACQKDNFFDKFPPEIMFFQNDKVENADFNEISLPESTTEYQVKARVSAPFDLKEIRIYIVSEGAENLVKTIDSFGNTPTEYFVYQDISGITGLTEVKFEVWDKDNRRTTKSFTIKLG